jgi:hypothetical protein
VPWEYTENEVSLGTIHSSTEQVKDAVKQWSTLTLHRDFRVVKSSLKIYDVHCVKPDCAFRVYAYKGKWDHYIEVRGVVSDTCTLDRIDARHRNISANFVASHMYPNIVENTSCERYRAALWPDVKSRWCTRHMKENFHSQFEKKALSKLFERLCEQTQ